MSLYGQWLNRKLNTVVLIRMMMKVEAEDDELDVEFLLKPIVRKQRW